MNKIKKLFNGLMSICLVFIMILSCQIFSGCSGKETIVIYTSSEDYKIEAMTSKLNERFPNYKIVIEYKSTGEHAAKLFSEGELSECDITHDLEFAYLDKLNQSGLLADLSSYNQDIYTEDARAENYIVELRNSGAIIINTEVLSERSISKPTCYTDLLKPEYKDLISMSSPKSSGTGYMFLKSLVNAWGEDEAFEYFEDLSENVLAFTSSGSGPVNALVNKEVAVGFGMTAQAVEEINEGAPLEILYFDEGAPFTLYGQSIVKGKETRACVREVFDYLINEYNNFNNETFFPEKIYIDKNYTKENYPQNIVYSDMSNNSISEKERLLDKWTIA